MKARSSAGRLQRPRGSKADFKNYETGARHGETLSLAFGCESGPGLSLASDVMKIVPYKSVGPVRFNAGRGELVNLLGAPDDEEKSPMWAAELCYPEATYRFDSGDRLKEISADVPVLEIGGEAVLFENLQAFLEQNDGDIFERAGFLVSPRYGVAFDPFFPSWVTVFARDELPSWRAIGIKT